MNAPFIVVGIVVVLISANVAYNWRELEYQSNSIDLQTDELMRLSVKLKAFERDLSNLLKNSVYSALWDVCSEANRYLSDEARENRIAELALERFQQFSTWLPLTRDEVRGFYEPTSIIIGRAENGFLQARCQINALLSIEGPQMKIARFVKEVETFVDCRYYLLQDKMNEFLRRLDEIHDRWRNLEYLSAWTKALMGEVKLSEEESATLFEAAWCQQELEVFGSFSPSLSLRFVSIPFATLRPAIEMVEKIITTLKGEVPVAEKVKAVRSGFSEIESYLQRFENFPRLRSILSVLRSKLDKIEDLTENEAERLLQGLLEEGSDEEVESWKLGQNGLQRVRVRAPRLENLTFPSLLRFLRNADAELSLLNPPELFPPKPMGPPGLSVLREMKVSRVSFDREDPCGRLGKAATPIYLWFLGTTVWWGQYTITVELENEPVEKILDYENPTIPLNLPLPAHYPLSYAYRIPKRKFRTRVVILLPRYFEIRLTQLPTA